MKKTVFLSLLSILVIGCKGDDEVTIQYGPLIHYTFDGDFTNLADGKNNGVQTGGVTFVEDRKGSPKSAVHLDGIDDYITFKNPLRENGNAFSISLWIRNGEIFNGNQVVVLRGATVTGIRASKQDSITSSICFDNYIGSGWRMVCHDIPYEGWFHVVGIYQRHEKGKLYINGVLANQDTKVPSTDVSKDFRLDSHLGAIIRKHVTGDPNTFWNGQIDDFRMYERALTNDEVSELYNE
ncbi:MAG: LamG domain-containing protein [Flavobacteriaceae bacterium]